MTSSPIVYGSSSPFSEDERETIERIYRHIVEGEHEECDAMAQLVVRGIQNLEKLGEVLATYPSPLREQQLGHRHRGLDSLVEALCSATLANSEFFLPTRAVVGRAMNMAECNFYRLLTHVCDEIIPGEDGEQLWERATQCLRLHLYSKLSEEVLLDIACDPTLRRTVRAHAVMSLAQLWDRRLTYYVRDFFPLLESTWEARQRIGVTGGTLYGTKEVLELFREGVAPEFVDYFARDDHSEDEIQAFREFLFGVPYEELVKLAGGTDGKGDASLDLVSPAMTTCDKGVLLFYEFFQSRYLQSVARKLGQQPGPKRTAEGYVMVYFLDQRP
jgi:hypothetical protein